MTGKNSLSPVTSQRPGAPSGQVLIITAISLITLLGFTGLAIDAGYVYFQKARLQNAADAAALALANHFCQLTPVAIERRQGQPFVMPGAEASPELPRITPRDQNQLKPLAEKFVAMSESDVAVEVQANEKDQTLTVVCRKNLKSFFSKIFGISLWKVSVVSNSTFAPVCSMGFDDSPYETGGMRPLALILPGSGLARGDRFDLAIGAPGQPGCNSFVISPRQAADFNFISRGLEYGFQGKFDAKTRLYQIQGFENSLVSALMNYNGRELVIPVVSPAQASSALHPVGFVKLQIEGGNGTTLKAAVVDLLRPRPVLAL